MAAPEPIGLATCMGCKRDVDVKKNAGGFAYYRCGCGHEERTHNNSSSRAFIAGRVKPVNFGYPQEAPGEKSEPAPAASPAAQPAGNSGNSPTTTKPEKAGFRFY